MTDPISNERLVEMLAEVEIEFDNALSDAEADQNPQLAVDPVGEFDLVELRSILTELQSRRSSSVKPSAILSQVALWSDDEGLELSMGQGDDLVRRIMSVVKAVGICEQMLVDAFVRGESWRKRNDVDRYVAVPEMVAKAARDYADYVLSSLSVKEPEGVEPVAWQCFDCIMEQWSVIDDAELAAARSRRDGEWIVRHLYASPPKDVTITDEVVERVFQAVMPFTAGTAYRELRAAIAAALSSEANNGREGE